MVMDLQSSASRCRLTEALVRAPFSDSHMVFTLAVTAMGGGLSRLGVSLWPRAGSASKLVPDWMVLMVR